MQREVMGNRRGRWGPRRRVYFRVMVQEPQGKEVEKRRGRTSPLSSSPDDADRNEDRHGPDFFGLLPEQSVAGHQMFRKQRTAKCEGQPGDTGILLLPFTGFHFTAETSNRRHLNPTLLMM